MTPLLRGETGDFPTDGGADRRPKKNVVLVKLLAFLGSRSALIAGLYAWAVTVLPVAVASNDSLALAVSGLALLVHVVSSVRPAGLPDSWVIATDAFIGLSATVWLLVPKALLLREMTTVQGALGMLGWGVFVLAALGAPAVAVPRSEASSAKAGLLSRLRQPTVFAELLLGGMVATAFGVQLLFWELHTRETAVFARVCLLALSVALLSVAGPVFLRTAARRAGARVGKPRLALAKRK